MKRKFYKNHLAAVGTSFSARHQNALIDSSEKISWLEIDYEHFSSRHNQTYSRMRELRQKHPICLSKTALGFEQDLLATKELSNLKYLVDYFEPTAINVPLSWREHKNYCYSTDLPLAFNADQIERCSSQLELWQSRLNTPVIFENRPRYLSPKSSNMTEIDFLNRLLNESDSFLALNLTSIYINCHYSGENPETFIKSINPHRVQQIVLTSQNSITGYFTEQENGPVWDATWKLYWLAKSRFEKAATLVRWSHQVDDFSRLMTECEKAKRNMAGEIYPSCQKQEFNVVL